jgi:hypothetical protein
LCLQVNYYSSWLCLLKGGAFGKAKVGPLLGVMQHKSQLLHTTTSETRIDLSLS